MRVRLHHTGGAKLEARGAGLSPVAIEGPESIGGTGKGNRPMELVLMGLAGCAAVDVQLILERGRHSLSHLVVEVDGERGDEVPAVFRKIHVVFETDGAVTEKAFRRAVELSMTKYCSVAKMLESSAEISFDVRFV